MRTTKKLVAQKLFAHLNHELSLASLVDWAEDALFEADFRDDEIEVLTDILGQIGLADSKAFGLTWEECERLMARLGYSLRVEMAEAV